MKQPAILTVLLILGAAASAAAQTESAKRSIADLGWMTGCWKQERGEGHYFKEQWTKPFGMMIGMAHTVRNGKMTSYEHLKIIEKDGEIYYVAIPSGQKETAFKMTSLKEGEAVFENPDHDFPQKIAYKKTEDGLTARVEATNDGQTRGFEVFFKRTSCDP